MIELRRNVTGSRGVAEELTVMYEFLNVDNVRLIFSHHNPTQYTAMKTLK